MMSHLAGLLFAFALTTCDGADYANSIDVIGTDDRTSNVIVLNGSYGVRWKKDNPNDMGERCLDAAGLTATFGVGNTKGHSDFDYIYPWSEIRRCNVRMDGNTPVVTFDDEPGFALDGSNGDVFVRIPKFYVDKYESDGYEYRVVKATGDRPHPAFIENGVELDAVYIGTFEGYIGKDGGLQSIADVTPTTNIVAQQFLEAAQQRGPQYSLYDMRCVDAGARLLCPGRALPRIASLLGFLPRKEQAARGWETPLAPFWPQLRSCLVFAHRPQASLGRAYEPMYAR